MAKKNPKIERIKYPGHSTSGARQGLHIIIICLLGIIIYSNSFKCTFHFDDFHTFIDNAKIHDISNIKAIWSISHTRFLGNLSFALNYYFSEQNPWSYHLVNLIIHLINGILVYWLTMLILSVVVSNQQSVLSKNKGTISLFVSLIFIAHPLTTEAITYVVQRYASLVALFYLLSVCLYFKGRLSFSKVSYFGKAQISMYLFYAGSFLSGIFALMTKENSFTLPLMIILSEIFFFQKEKLKLSFKDYRFIILIIGFIGIALLSPVILSFKMFNTVLPSEGHTYFLTPSTYLITQFRVIVTYIRLLFLPYSQTLDYDYRVSKSLFEIDTFICFIFLVSLIIASIFLFRKYRIISFGFFWFFITLSIESSLIPINDVIFEHRTYLPSFGFILSVTCAVYYLAWNKFKNVVIAFFIFIILIFSYLTYQRNNIWQDEISLWTDNVLKAPYFARPINNLGKAKSMNGDIPGGLSDFNKALALNPEYYVAYYNRGVTRNMLKDYKGAIEDYTKALTSDTTSEAIYINRADSRTKINDFPGAINDYKKAIKLNPDNAVYYFLKAVAETNMQKFNDAINDYKEAIRLNPDYAEAYLNRGIAKYNNKDISGACNDWKKANDSGNQNAAKYIQSYCK